MNEFTKSKYASTIYYADIFRINKKNWMLLGHGKSEAGILASNNDRGCDLSRDCVALTVKSGKLYGRYDPGALGKHHCEDSELHKFHNIDYIAYCLSPEQTAKLYKFKEIEMTNCDRKLMSRLSVIYPYPAYTAHFAFNPVELKRLSDPERRTNTFYKLMNEADI